MPISFPSNPITGQTYTDGNKTFTYNGKGWTTSIASVALTTANISEQNNLYFTNARSYSNVTAIGFATNANVNLKANIADLTTSNVLEVNNLYFTNARVRTAITSGNGIIYDNTVGNITLSQTGVIASTYGNATIIPVITVDAFGRITNVSNVSSGGGGAGTITSVAGVSSGAISNTQLSAGVSAAGLSDIGNVTLSNTSIIMTGAAVSRIVNLGNTIALCNINVQAGSYFTANSNVNTTWQFTNASSAANVAQAFTLELYNGGSFTQTWPNAVRWPGNVAPALSPNLYDMLVFVTDSNGTSWRGSVQTGYTA